MISGSREKIINDVNSAVRGELSIVCHEHEGGERERQIKRISTVTVISGWTCRRAVWHGQTAERDKRRRGELTGSRRSISTLHLWQKNRDIGLPSTTASAMFYVSLSSPSLLATVTVGSIRLRPAHLGSARLGSHRPRMQRNDLDGRSRREQNSIDRAAFLLATWERTTQLVGRDRNKSYLCQRSFYRPVFIE